MGDHVVKQCNKEIDTTVRECTSHNYCFYCHLDKMTWAISSEYTV